MHWRARGSEAQRHRGRRRRSSSFRWPVPLQRMYLKDNSATHEAKLFRPDGCARIVQSVITRHQVVRPVGMRGEVWRRLAIAVSLMVSCAAGGCAFPESVASAPPAWEVENPITPLRPP